MGEMLLLLLESISLKTCSMAKPTAASILPHHASSPPPQPSWQQEALSSPAEAPGWGSQALPSASGHPSSSSKHLGFVHPLHRELMEAAVFGAGLSPQKAEMLQPLLGSQAA